MPYANLLRRHNATPFSFACGRSARWLVPVIYTMAAFAFIEDLYRDNILAYGIIYVPLVVTGVLHKKRASVWFLAAAACIMVMIGALCPAIDSDLPDAIGNRILSILAIIATAAFIHHARDVQDRLADATRRAEAAERIKTAVLTDLSQEIRTPLHTLLGVLTLTMATSRPEQREALGRVRSDGKQLLATIDNLIDLTQLEEHNFHHQAIDIATIARDAAANAAATARERQVTVAMNTDRDIMALGDAWATRRILDNLLDNAVRVTPPGGTVSVSLSRSDDTVTASVIDTGRGLPPELARIFHQDTPVAEDGTLPTKGAAGLALSNRLARAMNGRLIAQDRPGLGAAVSVTLPAA